MTYQPIIGLEIHAQLQTASKIFCRCRAGFGGEQNSRVCPVCLGMPGALPVLNKQVVEYALRIACATHCRVAHQSVFARKNYFYPDLPKGYQISQFEKPLCENGFVEIEIDGSTIRVGLTRIHLEEDAGKSVHAEEYVSDKETLIDVNRCGTPLIEIVSKPELRSPQEAARYITYLRQLVQYLEICDGNMENGSLRCDANVSVRPEGAGELGVKTELKNMNSIRGVEKALEFEIERQIEILASGGAVLQETLLWDADKNIAIPMRSKEFSHDYRYFPEPDLVPLDIDEEWIDEVKANLPELPMEKKNRFIHQFKIPAYDAQVLTESKNVADYFEAVAKSSGDAKASSNWVMGDVLRTLKEKHIDITDLSVKPDQTGELLKLIHNGTISGKIAKSVFEEMVRTGESAAAIIEQKGLVQISDTGEIESRVRQVLADNPAEVEKFLNGKEQVIGFLVGQVMKATRGKANPKLVNDVLRNELQKTKR
ncbi:MAG: Asp-tRNA(Asn)/Glu-tRNA(Gln) amidotransferase subunit GatB [bacterium]